MPGMEALIASTAVKSSATAVFKAASELAQKTAAGPAKNLAIRAIASLVGYSSYIEETNSRVSTFKTFADPTKPVSLLDHFVKTKFQLDKNDKTLDENGILRLLRKPQRLVISATAGYGKSMVMRYLSLALFENPSGKIPIFLELRSLNRVSTPDLISYINSSYRQNSSVQVEAFRQALASGSIILLLDGFDEINHDIRSQIEDQILEITRLYPMCSVVVSGRPDDRFKAWKDFTLYRILPMSQNQVIKLIQNLDYDHGVRNRFIKNIKSGLYKSHQSFMSTPLLAILMLLTFEQNANIPDKMHLFYSDAFRTLFHKHDALKEQYDRSRKSKLSIDDFEKVLSVFCLKTYVLEKLEFNETEILSHIKSALEFCVVKSSPVDFLFDLEESVCIISQEGGLFFFIHRSFQEYFTAVFLAGCPDATRNDFIERVATRYWDNVLPMLFDMAENQIVPSWVAPNCAKYLSDVGDKPGQITPLQARFTAVTSYKYNGRHELMGFEFGKYWRFLCVLRRFYKNTEQSSHLRFDVLESWIKDNWSVLSELHPEVSIDESNIPLIVVPILQMPQDLLIKSGFIAMAEAEHKQIKVIERSLDKNQKVKNSFLDDLFNGR